jgi:hypothetical protein
VPYIDYHAVPAESEYMYSRQSSVNKYFLTKQEPNSSVTKSGEPRRSWGMILFIRDIVVWDGLELIGYHGLESSSQSQSQLKQQ